MTPIDWKDWFRSLAADLATPLSRQTLVTPIDWKLSRRGPRWELLDQVVRAFVRYVYDPAAGLSLPMRR